MVISPDILGSMLEAAHKAGYDAGRQSMLDGAYNSGWDDGYARCDEDHAREKEADIKANICDEPTCTKAVSCGWGPASDRRHTCYHHSDWFKESKL